MRRRIHQLAGLLTRHRAGQAGTGLVGTTVGVTIFLAFLLLATQVLLGLYTTSLVTSAPVDAATAVARAADPTSGPTQQDASDRARRRLGAFARRENAFELDWSSTTADDVVVVVHARTMSLLPPSFGAALGNRIDRTIHVRAEHLR